MRHMHRILSKDLIIRLLLEPTCLGANLCCKVTLNLAGCCKKLGGGPCISSKKIFGLCKVVQEGGGALHYGFSKMGLGFE